jgi:hypothetical protein
MLDTIANRKQRRETTAVIAPCDDCRHARRCESEALACQAFVLFKRCSPSPQRWSCAPRLPSRDLYERAMQPVIERTKPRRLTEDCEMDERESGFEEAFDLEGEFAESE